MDRRADVRRSRTGQSRAEQSRARRLIEAHVRVSFRESGWRCADDSGVVCLPVVLLGVTLGGEEDSACEGRQVPVPNARGHEGRRPKGGATATATRFFRIRVVFLSPRRTGTAS